MPYIGYIAAFFTTIAFVPQVIKVMKTRLTRDISLGWILTLFIGIILWLVHGVMVGDGPLIAANVVSFVLSGVLLGYKLKYK